MNPYNSQQTNPKYRNPQYQPRQSMTNPPKKHYTLPIIIAVLVVVILILILINYTTPEEGLPPPLPEEPLENELPPPFPEDNPSTESPDNNAPPLLPPQI